MCADQKTIAAIATCRCRLLVSSRDTKFKECLKVGLFQQLPIICTTVPLVSLNLAMYSNIPTENNKQFSKYVPSKLQIE